MVKTENPTPSVSIIMPVRNEEEYIRQCLQSIIRQDYPNITEILVFDGMSDDGTRKTIQEFEDLSPGIKVLDNPLRMQTHALNRGIKLARGEIIIRMDAHALYEYDYVSQCVSYLINTGAAIVGGPILAAKREKYIADAISFTYESKFGIGVGKLHHRNYQGYVDVVSLGACWKSIFNKVGLYREELVRSEDIEWTRRLRNCGCKAFQTPEIRFYYFPRENLIKIWRQNFDTGAGIMQTIFLVNPRAVSLRHLVPFCFVIGLMSSIFVTFVFNPIGKLLLATIMGPYLIASVFSSIAIGFKRGGRYIPIMPLVFGTIHFSYGFGSIWGLLKFGLVQRLKKLLRKDARMN